MTVWWIKIKVTQFSYSSDNNQVLKAVKPEQQMESDADGLLLINDLLTLSYANISLNLKWEFEILKCV